MLLLAARRPCVCRTAFPSGHSITCTSCAGLRRNAAPSAAGGGVCSGWRAVLILALARVLCTNPSGGPRPRKRYHACGPGWLPDRCSTRGLLSVSLSRLDDRHASRRAREDTLGHNVLAHKGLTGGPRTQIRVSPFRQSETQCMHARARGSPKSPPKGPPLPLSHTVLHAVSLTRERIWRPVRPQSGRLRTPVSKTLATQLALLNFCLRRVPFSVHLALT